MNQYQACLYLSEYIFLCGFKYGHEISQFLHFFTNLVKNVNFLEFGDYIWNPYEKCIQKSPNMPCIGSLIREIDVNISEI